MTYMDYNHAEENVQRMLDSSTGSFRDDFQQRATEFVKVVAGQNGDPRNCRRGGTRVHGQALRIGAGCRELKDDQFADWQQGGTPQVADASEGDRGRRTVQNVES
jgi:hypothetical protein